VSANEKVSVQPDGQLTGVRGDELLVVDNMTKYFPITRGIIFQKQIGAVKAVDGVSFAVREGEGKPQLEIGLKYYAGKPVIERLERVSKPGLRVYKGRDDIPRVMNGLGVAILSTSRGVMCPASSRTGTVSENVSEPCSWSTSLTAESGARNRANSAMPPP